MIYEVKYTTEQFQQFDSYLNNVFKVDFKSDCFVFFYFGKNSSKYLNTPQVDYLTAYRYIQDLQDKFNVNINWYDLSYFFDNLQKIECDKDDAITTLYYLKRTYLNYIQTVVDKILEK